MARNRLFMVGAALAAAGALALTGCADDTGETGRAPTQGQTQAEEPKEPEVRTETTEDNPEREDLTRLVLLNGDHYGVVSAEVEYTIVNHSAKASDYDITADIMKDGKRIDTVWIYETNVKPGQKVENWTIPDWIEMVPEGATLENVEVDRTEAI